MACSNDSLFELQLSWKQATDMNHSSKEKQEETQRGIFIEKNLAITAKSYYHKDHKINHLC